MSFRGITTTAVAIGLLWTGPAFSQDDDDDDVPGPELVIQGGFSFTNPEVRRPQGTRNGLVGYATSEGNTVESGGRFRVVIGTVCSDLVYTLQASETITRTTAKIKEKQKQFVTLEFVFFDCADEGPRCVLGTSNSVPRSDCKGLLKLNTGSKAGIDAKVNLTCKDRISTGDPLFDMTAQERAWADAAFPGLIDGLTIKYKDEAAREIPLDQAENGLFPTCGTSESCPPDPQPGPPVGLADC